MKKTLSFHLTALTAILLMVCACTKQTDYSNAIPSDAKAIGSINFQALAQKADLGGEENQAMIQKMAEALKAEMSADTYRQIETMLDDPAQSGIDFNAPVYIFSSPQISTAILAKVSDADKLTTLLQSINKEQAIGNIEEGDGYKYCTANGQNIVAFTPTTLLIASCDSSSELEQLKETTANLLKQSGENSMTANAGFQKLQQAKGDISVYMPLGTFYDFMEQAYAGMNIDMPDAGLLRNSITLASLTFKNGEVVIDSENYTENPELKALLNKMNEAVYPIENKYLDRFPQSSIMLFSGSINGRKYFNYLQENKAFNEQLARQLTPEQMEMAKQILDLFDGEFICGITDFNLRNGMPLFALYSDSQDGQLLEQVHTQLTAAGIPLIQNGENEYEIAIQNVRINLGMDGNVFYITNDKPNMGKEQTPSASSNDYAKKIKGQNVAFILDVNAICSMPIVQTMAQFGGAKAQAYVDICEKIDYLEVHSTLQHSTISLKLKDKDTNALKQIVDATRTIAGL